MCSSGDCVSYLSWSGDSCPQSGYELDFNMKPFSALQIWMKLSEQSLLLVSEAISIFLAFSLSKFILIHLFCHLKDASEFCLLPSVNEFFLLSRRLILAFEHFSFKQVQNRLLAGILSLPTSMTVLFRYKTRELKLTILGRFSCGIPDGSLWLINLEVCLIVSRYVGTFFPNYWKRHAMM